MCDTMKNALALLLASRLGFTVAFRQSSECTSGLLGRSVTLLAEYTPAQAYCAAQFEATAIASSITVTSCLPEPTAVKQDSDLQQRDDFDEFTTEQAAEFARLRRMRLSTQQTFCSCIETSPSPKVVSVTADCAKGQYCSLSGICKPKRNCRNPARCDSDSYCLEAAAGACFCHPDTENSNLGYCMSAGPSGKGCPDVYEDCSSNAQCGGARVCIYACCREEPFCVDLTEYDPDTPNTAAPSR